MLLVLALTFNAIWMNQIDVTSFAPEQSLKVHQQLYFTPVDLTQGIDGKDKKVKNLKDPVVKNLWVFDVSFLQENNESQDTSYTIFSPIPLFTLLCSYLL